MYPNKVGSQDDKYTKHYKLQETFDTGDVVATPQGRGVVSAEIRDTFEFPTGPGEGSENIEEITARQDMPAYVVGFGGRSAVYRASSLDHSEFGDTDMPKQSSGKALATVSHVDVEESDLPEGWTTQSLLDFWASVGGTWREAVTALEDTRNFSTEEAQQTASDYKTQILGTDRWRNRF